MRRVLAKLAIGAIKGILWVLDPDHRSKHKIQDDLTRKFTHSQVVDFQSDRERAIAVHRTIPYRAYELVTETRSLVAAHKHLVHTPDRGCVWVETLRPGDLVSTETGPERVVSVVDLGVDVHMYDVELTGPTHLYSSNGIISHNTQTAAAFLLWWTCFKETQHVLVASNKGRNALEIMERFKFMYEELPWWIKPGVEKYNEFTVEFDNRSKVEAQATTASTGRGLTLNLLYNDEWAYVPENIQEPMFLSVQPALAATNGKWIITSTCNSDADKFAKIWFSAKDAPLSEKWEDYLAPKADDDEDEQEENYDTVYEDGYNGIERDEPSTQTEDEDDEDGRFVRFFSHWTSHPDRDERFRKRQLRSGMSTEQWDREFGCQFISAEATLIEATKLLSLNSGVRKPRFVDKYGTHWYENIRPNTIYAMVLDPSEGVGGDNSVIQVWSVPNLRQVAEWASNTADQIEQTRMLIRIMKRIYDTQQSHPEHIGESGIYYSVECNGIGMGVINAILVEGEEKFPGYLIDSDGNKGRGIRTTSTSKRTYALVLKTLIERNRFVPRSKGLVEELKQFVKSGEGFEGKSSKDDRVMSCVLMCHLLEELKYHEDGVEEAMHVDLVQYEETDGEDPREMAMGIIV